MTALLALIPISMLLGLAGLAAFIWSVSTHQYDDLEGEANRILDKRYDDAPVPRHKKERNVGNRFKSD